MNDYYPHIQLAKLLHKDKRYDKEVEVIEQLFKSGIYFDENQLSWCECRLRRLTRDMVIMIFQNLLLWNMNLIRMVL